MQNLYKTCFKTFLLITVFLVIACKKDDALITPPKPEPARETIVYVAGYENPDDRHATAAMYWKNGVPVQLTAGNTPARANSIFVSGNDVYVAGYEAVNATYVGKYWKNGVSIELPYIPKPSDGQDPTSGIVFTIANSIFISDNDVYVAGVTMRNSTPLATYWKNGVPVDLGDGSSSTSTTSIFVSGNDVYVAGTDRPYSTDAAPEPKVYAKYWKNGVAVTLTDGKQLAKSNSIFVSGNDVYVAGYEYTPTGQIGPRPIAKYWKNGIPVTLTDGSKFAEATSIIVSNNDVYVTGYEASPTGILIIKTWKNGTAVNLSNPIYHTSPPSMYLLGSDVYVAGSQFFGPGDAPYYWKNGVEVKLSENTKNGIATSIFVTK